MSSHLPKIKSLLERKDVEGLRVYLAGLKATEKGLAFEQFLELLYNGNGYTAVRQGGRGDLGADILLYDSAKEGIYCVIQAKNHSSPLNFDDTVSELNKFETKASEKHGCREFEIISMNGFVAEAAKLGRFRLNLRDWRYVEGLVKTYDPDNKCQPVIRLLSHNQETFDAAIISLNAGSRVACIQATGTGKSYIIAKTMNQFPTGKKLVIAPSNHILNQQKSVAPWLNRSTKYMTYAAAKNLTAADIEKMNPSLIVLDEFHRAGADAWGAGVEKILDQCPDAKVLGTTATPIRYLDGERDMSDELFDEEAVNLPLAEAIQRNILPSPNYVASLYTLNEEADNLLDTLSKSALSDEEKKKIKGDIEQEKIDWEKSSGVPEILKKYLSNNKHNKFIVFCKDKKHLDELEDEVRKWIRKTGLFEDRETYRVYSGYRKSDENLEAFLAAKGKTTAHILMAIDMLNEGMHAPDVGAVLLFRPTESPRIFYQQIGRCLQVGTDAEPIIFDFVNNFQSIRAGDFINDLNEAGEKERELREQFGLSADYLPKIHVHDESLEILEAFRKIDERLGSWETRFKELVAYKEEQGDCLVPDKWEENKSLGTWVGRQRSTKDRLDADKIKRLDELGFVWDPLELTWEIQFQELVSYKEEHGDCLVPRSWKNKQLAVWVSSQRAKKSKLDAEKITRLDELGFVWDPFEQTWEIQFQELVSYKEKQGDCLVPARWKENEPLATWVGTQRSTKDRLDADKIKRLDELGFVWVSWQQIWETRFKELVAYKEGHGDCLVPRSWKNGQLATWVNNQRAKKSKLDAEKITRLDELGFVWDPFEQTWEIQFQELVSYKEKQGDCLVPRSWENKQLARWVGKQRSTKDRLDADKIKRLDELGFVWDPLEQAWETRFKELVAYKEGHGDCLVPRSWKNGQLATWVGKQRSTKDRLDADKIKRLDELGFVWDHLEQKWEIQFQELVSYKEKQGDCLVPRSWKNKQLASWVKSQRAKKSKLDTEKITRLDELGFVWGSRQQLWETRFKELVAYKEKHGNCLVPDKWEENKPLGKWVGKQRTRKGKLDGERIKRLDELGFVWVSWQQLWETRFKELVAYKEEQGDCLVPDKWEENKSLGTWVGRQRSTKDRLDADKIKRLDELGFVWDPLELTWEIQFQELVSYKEKQGDCLVPRSWKENEPLASWVSTQRAFWKKGKLDAEKITRLDKLGFVWDPFELTWEIQFQELVSYKEEYGDCLVPARWKENEPLATWVSTQRSKKDRLDADKIKRLDELGFVWDHFEQKWEIQFQELVSYKQEHGDCLVPARWEENKPLASWVHNQRSKIGKLDGERIKRLDELGFVWGSRQQIWETRFKELVAYKEGHGDCLVPRSWKNGQLATWVSTQRAKKSKLDAEKITRLDELGFVWDAKKLPPNL